MASEIKYNPLGYWTVVSVAFSASDTTPEKLKALDSALKVAAPHRYGEYDPDDYDVQMSPEDFTLYKAMCAARNSTKK